MKPKLRPLGPLLAAAALLSAGCETQPATSASPPVTSDRLQPLENLDFKCVRLVAGGDLVALPADAEVTLRFTGPGKVAGRAAVNRYFGGFTLGENGGIKWTPLGSTRMAGPADRMKLESQFLQSLAATTQLALPPTGLLFRDSDSKNLVEFSR